MLVTNIASHQTDLSYTAASRYRKFILSCNGTLYTNGLNMFVPLARLHVCGDLTPAMDIFFRANGDLHELKTQQTDLEAKLGNDCGLEEALAALVDKGLAAQVWVSYVMLAAAYDSA